MQKKQYDDSTSSTSDEQQDKDKTRRELLMVLEQNLTRAHNGQPENPALHELMAAIEQRLLPGHNTQQQRQAALTLALACILGVNSFAAYAYFLSPNPLLLQNTLEKQNKARQFPDIIAKLNREQLSQPFADNACRHDNALPNRVWHGTFHAIMTAHMARALYEHVWQFADFLKPVQTKSLRHLQSKQDLELLMLAGFCHDMANTSENFHDEAAQAELFKENMLACGYSEKTLAPFVAALRGKEKDPIDAPLDLENSVAYLRLLIHDADVLEMLRLLPLNDKDERKQPGTQFDLRYLQLRKLFEKPNSRDGKSVLYKTYQKGLHTIVLRYRDLYRYLYHTLSGAPDALHDHISPIDKRQIHQNPTLMQLFYDIETSATPWQTMSLLLKKIIHNISLRNALLLDHADTYPLTLDVAMDEPMLDDIPISEWLHTYLAIGVSPKLMRYLQEKCHAKLVSSQHGNPWLLRTVQNIDKELTKLAKNALDSVQSDWTDSSESNDVSNDNMAVNKAATTSHQSDDSSTDAAEEDTSRQSASGALDSTIDTILTTFRQHGSTQASGTLLSPATLLMEGCPITPHNPNTAALLLDPRTPIAHAYKRNVLSDLLSEGQFWPPFASPTNVKAQQTDHVQHKIAVHNARRSNPGDDKYCRHAYHPVLRHNEALTLMGQQDIAGVVGFSHSHESLTTAHHHALALAKAGINLGPCYVYHSELGVLRQFSSVSQHVGACAIRKKTVAQHSPIRWARVPITRYSSLQNQKSENYPVKLIFIAPQ